MSVDSAKRVQFVGAALLGDYAVREHDNLVGAGDGAHSVRDDEHVFVLDKPRNGGLDKRFVL